MAVRLAKVMAAFMALTHGPKRSKSVPSAQQEPDASSSLVWVPKTTLDVWFLEVATRVERTTCTNTCACTCAVRGSTRYRTNASLHQADAITDVMTSMPFYVYGLHRAVSSDAAHGHLSTIRPTRYRTQYKCYSVSTAVRRTILNSVLTVVT